MSSFSFCHLARLGVCRLLRAATTSLGGWLVCRTKLPPGKTNPIFCRFWALFSPFRAAGRSLVFDQFFLSLGFRPISIQNRGGLKRKSLHGWCGSCGQKTPKGHEANTSAGAQSEAARRSWEPGHQQHLGPKEPGPSVRSLRERLLSPVSEEGKAAEG